MSADLRSLLFCSRLLACTLTLDWVPRDTLPSQRHPDEHPPRRDMLLAHVRVQPWRALTSLAQLHPLISACLVPVRLSPRHCARLTRLPCNRAASSQPATDERQSRPALIAAGGHSHTRTRSRRRGPAPSSPPPPLQPITTPPPPPPRPVAASCTSSRSSCKPIPTLPVGTLYENCFSHARSGERCSRTGQFRM